MLKLIKNELIKILKRKNIYILTIIAVFVICGYNTREKMFNNKNDIKILYQKAYNNDKLSLENYQKLKISDNYEDIIERINLEEYALENNIEYNILINSQNKNVQLPTDARKLLMKAFDNFDIIIIFMIVYLSSTIITEEYSNGTIKYVLTKPHARTKILLSKLLSNIIVIIFVLIFIVLFQYLLGGLLFGFESYNLIAIRYNIITQNIETMNLLKYMLMIIISKFPMYLILTLVSLLLGIITNNIALNILISLGLYFASIMDILINKVTKYLFIFNWDISKYLFNSESILKPITLSIITFIITLALLIVLFKNKDIRNG